MSRQLPYTISYKTIKFWRSFENVFLWITFIVSIIIQLLHCASTENCYISCIQKIIHFINYISIIGYGFLYIIVEIIMQPMVASERRKGFIDNSLGTKLLPKPVINYYDNDSIDVGVYKMMVNCYENCFFTYNIAKKMLLRIILKNLVLCVILLTFAYIGIKNNIVAMPLLQVFLSSLFLLELAYHITFFFKLKALCEKFNDIFSNKGNRTRILHNAIYMTLEYETTLAYNKSPNSDAVYNKIKDQLTEDWKNIKNRYEI